MPILLHAVRTRVSDNGEENSSDDLFSRFLYASRFLAFIVIPINLVVSVTIDLQFTF